jgi:hypothetical protein
VAVTSHSDGVLATAAFSSVTIAPPPPAFTFAPIGTSTAGGSEDMVMHTVTLSARGTDIWGTSDQFMFANTSWTGDGVLTAQVQSVDSTNAWAKAGVMFRSTTATGAVYAAIYVTPGKGIALQYRTLGGTSAAQVAQVSGVAPVFLRLTRASNVFTGAWSTDLMTWHNVGSIALSVDATMLAGLAVTSHNTSATATAFFADPTLR